MATDTHWLNPVDFVTGDRSLKINSPSVAHPGVEIKAKTPGDSKWIFLGLTIPPNQDIQALQVCYQLSNPRSFISQIRLIEMRTPDQAIVHHDDTTDLLSITPTCYRSPVVAFRPAASVMLALRLNFTNVTDTIKLSSIGMEVLSLVRPSQSSDVYRASDVGILISNTAEQNSVAWDAWYASISGFNTGATLEFERTILNNYYNFARTLEIQKPIKLRCGGAPGGLGVYSSYLRWPANTTGIWLRSWNPNPPHGRGDCSRIEDLVLVGLGYGAATSGHGILMEARCVLKNLWITNFGGNGVSIEASSGNFPPTNANLWFMEGVASVQNKGHGFFINGADANAGTAILCNGSSNSGWGFYDSSFLGNTYIGCHTDANLAGSYKVDDVNARCTFIGCYHEGGQHLPNLSPSNSTWIGGLVEGRIQGGSTVIKDGRADGMFFRAAGLNRYDSLQGATLGSAPQEGLQAFLRTSTVEDGSFPQQILHFDKTNLAHEYVWYSTAGDQSSGIKIASVNSENNGRAVPPGMWTFPTGHLNGSQRFDSGSRVPSSNRLWRVGDIQWNSAAVAGGHTGWVCVLAGMTGTYTESRTAKADGSAVIILNATSSILKPGDIINCNGTVGAVIIKVGEFASGTVTCASVQEGDTLTLLSTVFRAVSGAAAVGEATFSKGANDTETAVSLALQIRNHVDMYGNTDLYQSVSVASRLGVVTITALPKGTSGNTYGLLSSNGNRLAVTGAGTLTSGDDGTKVTLNTVVSAGTELPIAFKAAAFSEFGYAIGGIIDSTGTPGAAIQNARRGRVAIAIGASSVVVTNSKVTSQSIVHATLQTVDATLTQILSVVPKDGSFTIRGNTTATSATIACWSLEE